MLNSNCHERRFWLIQGFYENMQLNINVCTLASDSMFFQKIQMWTPGLAAFWIVSPDLSPCLGYRDRETGSKRALKHVHLRWCVGWWSNVKNTFQLSRKYACSGEYRKLFSPAVSLTGLGKLSRCVKNVCCRTWNCLSFDVPPVPIKFAKGLT